MKKYKLTFLIVALVGGFMITGCNNSSETKEAVEQESESAKGKEYTSKYVCPMHCEGSGSDEPGNCPVCGMDYVENEDAKHHEH